MKRMIAVFMALLLAMAVPAALAEGGMTGGWTLIEAEPAKLPEDAAQAFDKAVAKLVGAEYAPVALLGSQLVSGANYCVLCRIEPVTPDARFHYALVYIYADLSDNAEITNIVDLDIAELSQPAAAE